MVLQKERFSALTNQTTSLNNLIEWANWNILSTSHVQYGLDDPLALVMLAKFIGNEGKITIHCSSAKEKAEFMKNLVVNNVDKKV